MSTITTTCTTYADSMLWRLRHVVVIASGSALPMEKSAFFAAGTDAPHLEFPVMET